MYDYLNIGCGSHAHPEWHNIDMVANAKGVRVYDLRKGLPYAADSMDATYSSHVLEHLSPEAGRTFIDEQFRVLRKEGVIRLVVPDLEQKVRLYLHHLERAKIGEDSGEYDWMLIELYDQFARRVSGGQMRAVLKDRSLPIRDFIRDRMGAQFAHFFEDEMPKDMHTMRYSLPYRKRVFRKIKVLLEGLRKQVAFWLLALLGGKSFVTAFREGLFINGGQLHLWMYDAYSVERLLKDGGFSDVRVCIASESRIPEFDRFELDVIRGKIRKADSLFVEAVK